MCWIRSPSRWRIPGCGDGGYEIFSRIAEPLAGPVGYTVRVLPRHPMLAASNELGLVTLACAPRRRKSS
ncbi:alpha-glucan phosphorylase [Mycobacterium tuberculosis CAS/NITR204]|uniref:Alpha-glucan phosphorylase n=1 Tax=Mycobacterium tuberculosis CAS/NITR204 TaxID=1310114 RepID=R4MHA5_MYCTX|nr:alpha-glucan phosphorylase [Mycobacterium tuberculosis CAS/NITR204]